jgi:hypothetical protein
MERKAKRRSKQTLDRCKGGTMVRVEVWVHKDLRNQARRVAKHVGVTLTDTIEGSLRALIAGAKPA